MKINVILSGHACVQIDDKLVQFPTKKSEGLFYYLLLHKKNSREYLELMFWPDLNQKSANKNLRNAIYYIKKIFGEDIFTREKGILELNPAIPIFIDDDPARGEILQGFTVKNCPEFEFFLDDYRKSQSLIQYNQLKEKFRSSLKNSDSGKTLEYYFALRRMNPYDEENVKLMMGFYQMLGEEEKSIRIYKDLEKELRNDLSVEPNAEIKELYRDLLLKKKVQIKKDSKYFYGRKKELETIRSAHGSFLNGYYHSNYIISASVGCGKSAFLNHYLATVEDKESAIVSVSCFEMEKNSPLRVMELIVSKFLSTTGTNVSDLPERCRYLFSYLFPLVANNLDYYLLNREALQSENQFFIEESLGEVFRWLLNKQKLLLFIDDLQFCDLPSLSYLTRVLCPVFKDRIFCLFTTRWENEKQVTRHFKELMVSGDMKLLPLYNFSKEEIADILSDLIGSSTQELVESLYEGTNGNPLFLLEVIHNLKNNNSPKDYRFLSLLEDKVENLTSAERSVLYIASCFSDYINYHIIAGVTNMELITTLEIIESLINQGFIKEDIYKEKTRLKFSHQKFQEYIYEKQSHVKRMTLHGKIADYITHHMLDKKWDNYLVDSAIYHYHQAGQSVKYLEYKIKKSNQIIDINNDFPKFLTPITQSYIEELEGEITAANAPVSLKFEYLLLKSNFYLHTCQYKEGLDCINYVIDCDHVAEHLLVAYRLLIFYSTQILDWTLMRKYALAVLHVLKKRPDDIRRGEVLKFYALSEIYCQHHGNAQRVLKMCLDMFETRQPDEYILSNIACIYNYMAYTPRQLGDYAATIPLYQKAISLCLQANIINGLPVYYMNMGQSQYKIGEVYAAERYFRLADQLHYNIDIPLTKSLTKAYLALIAFRKGEWKEAENFLESAIKLDQILKNLYEAAYLHKIICIIKYEVNQKSDFVRDRLERVVPEPYSYYYDLAKNEFQRLTLDREMEDLALPDWCK